jgi:murein DD-endopeptidase MepM/ murein hydrolase activator NlpD
MADPGVLRSLLSAANRLGASPKERKALLEAGLVESGLRNLNYGDRDSLGVLQERTSIYGRSHALNPTASAERFLRQARGANRPGISAGQLAQAVQRSAFPGRYDEVGAKAAALLGGSQNDGGSGRVGSGSASVTVTPGTAQNGFDPGAQTGVSSLAGLLGQSQAPPVGIPVAPTPAIQSPVIASPVVQGNGLADALAAIQTGPQSLPQTSTSSPSVKVSGGGPTASAASAGSAGSGRYPTGRVGKIIGTPYAGTHTLGNWQSDNAVDIAVPVGTPMVALQSGTVVKVRHHPQDGGRFAGDQITIRGANGNEYFYAHGVAGVRPGQRIRKGQSLGTTGSANGVAHLHFGQMKGDPRMHTRAGR